MEKGLIDIHICYRDRPSELGLLLQSLRTQTYQNFRILISDDCSGTRIENYYFLVYMITRLKAENHEVVVSVCPFPHGVSKNRQRLVDISMREDRAEFICRLDDDVILAPDYLERLIKVIEKGYDLATGVTPFFGASRFKRESKFLYGVANRVIFDSNGKFVWNGDDCGIEYLDEAIVPIHHFRSCALYKAEIHNKVDYKSRLSKHGFREETLLSFKMILAGYKLGCDVKAIAEHLQCPSGGERFPEQNELIQLNQRIMEETVDEMFVKNGDFIQKYNQSLNIPPWQPDIEEMNKETNLVRLR